MKREKRSDGTRRDQPVRVVLFDALHLDAFLFAFLNTEGRRTHRSVGVSSVTVEPEELENGRSEDDGD